MDPRGIALLFAQQTQGSISFVSALNPKATALADIFCTFVPSGQDSESLVAVHNQWKYIEDIKIWLDKRDW